MLTLNEIFNKAYFYIKNHKQLWFFGFFLNLSALVWLGNFSRLQYLPAFLLLCTFVVIGAYARSIVLNIAVKLERKEPVEMKKDMRNSVKYVLRVLTADLIFIIILVLLSAWLFFSRTPNINFIFFVVIYFVLIAITNFAQCFIVAHNMNVYRSLKSAVDLLLIQWWRVLLLFILVSALTVMIVFLIMHLIMISAALAFTPIFLIKSVSVPLLLIIGAILNIFSTFCWMIFFLDVIKANKIGSESFLKSSANNI